MTAWEIVETPLGPLFVGASTAGVHRIDFVREGRDEGWLRAALDREAAAIARADRAGGGGDGGDGGARAIEAARQLAAYFAREHADFALPLAPHGTVFQRAVWSELRAIPVGETRSYARIAVAVGRPAAVRAVGQAVGRNPLSIVVPCHRVIGSDGSLTGYAGGLDRKRWLLAREGAPAAEGSGVAKGRGVARGRGRASRIAAA
jgi:methylated-DNA-[protein]-cysteine S-methyltransferase